MDCWSANEPGAKFGPNRSLIWKVTGRFLSKSFSLVLRGTKYLSLSGYHDYLPFLHVAVLQFSLPSLVVLRRNVLNHTRRFPRGYMICIRRWPQSASDATFSNVYTDITETATRHQPRRKPLGYFTAGTTGTSM